MLEKDKNSEPQDREQMPDRVRFEVYGQEMLAKRVRTSGHSGRVYLPANWVGRQVKVIRID